MSLIKYFPCILVFLMVLLSSCDLFNNNQAPELGQVNCVLTDLYVEFTWTRVAGTADYLDIVYNGKTYSTPMFAYSARITDIAPADQYDFTVYARSVETGLSKGLTFSLVPAAKYRVSAEYIYAGDIPAAGLSVSRTLQRPLKNVLVYDYNDLGQVNRKNEYSPDLKIEKYEDFTYDSAGKISTRKLTEKDQVTENDLYEYDDHGNLKKIKDKDGKEKGPVSEYTYDSQGRLTCQTITEKNQVTQTIAYRYDSCGELLNESVTDGKTALQTLKEYVYTGSGLVKGENWSTAGVVTYQIFRTYDSLNRLTLLDQNDIAAGTRVKTVYVMGLAGNPCKIATYINDVLSECSEKYWEPDVVP
jgi:YD repeat-containing protein